MAQLFAGMRAHQVFGADTEVGKTIFSTGYALAGTLCSADASVRGPRTLAPRADAERVAYLKPVSTGPPHEMDAGHLQQYAPWVHSSTMLQFAEPVSPHLASVQKAGTLPHDAHDAQIVSGIGAWLLQQARASVPAAAIIETAGGVNSPAPSGSSQADLLRPLRLPVVLVGSSKLGGISTTRSALESLRMRGYDVEAVLMFPSQRYQNDAYLQSLLAEEYAIPVFALGGPNGDGWGAPPVRAVCDEEDHARMRDYYIGLVHGREDGSGTSMLDVVRHLRAAHAKRLARLSTMASKTREVCWWPFTQHGRYTDEDVMVIDSAYGDFFAVHNNTPQTSLLAPALDGSASWWTQVLGHGHARLGAAAAYAAGRYGHVLFPGATNEPALALSETLLGKRPLSFSAPGHGWASRVFFSDDGSTAMEVALKMAIQSSVRRYAEGEGEDREWQVLGLQGSYHGDTIGVMDACEPSVYSDHVAWYKGRGYWLAPPTLRVKHGKVHVIVRPNRDWAHWERDTARDEIHLATFDSMQEAYDVTRRMQHGELYENYRAMLHTTLTRLVRDEGRRFGALVLEPLVMGAGGMLFVDPLFQRCLVDVVREQAALFGGKHVSRTPSQWQGLPVIYDEIFTGLFRIGIPSAADVLGTSPDIACYAKILSGGLVPLSATLASSSIFDTFAHSDEKTRALLHGHSYTAHPVGCSVALETFAILDEMHMRGDWAKHQEDWGSTTIWSFWNKQFVQRLSAYAHVESVMALGTVLKIALVDQDAGAPSVSAQRRRARKR
ncbi:hypothetical protein MVES_003126 [Malassezia vespertilionis]|uniref:Uncharacterized protein n=1 Tax=Malassezia vespertilionis TaxID=2020962 RepID=A0A2N1J8G2_9BASI|nr:hypothetical protein MVES_003126 [Malassezia vespertilionis]